MGDIGQGIAEGLKIMFIATAIGGVAIGGAGALIAATVLSSDVAFDLNDSTKAAAKDGTLTSGMLCNEMLKAQGAIAEQLGKTELPVVIMDMATCQRLYQGPRQ